MQLVLLIDKEVNEFSKKLQNVNTRKKTTLTLKVYLTFLNTCDKERDIEVVTPVEVQEIRFHEFTLGICARSMGFCCSPSWFQFLRHLLNELSKRKQISLVEKTDILSVIFKLKI